MTLSTTKSPAASNAPGQYDWEKGQQMFESGVHSVGQIARVLGCTTSAVSNRATRYGWTRDPLGVAKLAEQRAQQLALSSDVERQKVIAITATMQSQVLVSHRKDIARARQVVSLLLDELTGVSSPENAESLEHMGELLANPDENGRLDRLNRIYRRVISMPERIAGINALSSALKVLIMLERQAYSIEGALVDPEAIKPQEEVIKGLDAIMDKFNQVLGMQVEATQPAIIVEVVDVPRQTEAPATAR